MTEPGRLEWNDGEYVAVCVACQAEQRCGQADRPTKATRFLREEQGWGLVYWPEGESLVRMRWACKACRHFLEALDTGPDGF